MNRRDFILSGAAAALPLFNIGCAGFGTSRAKRIAQGAKIRLAAVGCGGRMCGSVNYGILSNFCSDCEVVCAADPDPRRYESVKKLVASRQPQADTSRIRFYRDYREMFEKEAEHLDAAAIAAPNHHHAPAAILAMEKGLHVYVEKPMALTIAEVAKMRAVARRTGVVTQVGNHGHSEEGMRVLVESIRAGMIGDVREVWSFNDRLNAMLEAPPPAPPPAGMDWDLWCGPAPVRDYYAATPDHGALHPHDWHDWIGYGNGSIGNMGTHILDPAFWALDLARVHPETVIANEAKWGCKGSWTWSTQVDWTYPARGSMPPVTLHWYDGVKPGVPYDREHVDRIGICTKRDYQNMPAIVTELEKRHNVDLGNLGTIFIGEKGAIKIGCHGNALIFMPKDLKRNFGKVPKFLPREKGFDHQTDWMRAIRDPSRTTGCCFEYSAPLATTVLLGNVAPQAGVGRKLRWTGEGFENDTVADSFLSRPVRRGWEV